MSEQMTGDWFEQFDPNNASANTGINGGYLPVDPNATISAAGYAPPNNPTAAPELGYWGSDTSAHTMQYTPEQTKFDDAFANYWAPDRPQVLASLRAGATQKTAAPMSSLSGGDTSMSGFNQAWLSSPYPGTVEGLKQFVAANPQYGVTLGGSKGDKVYGPGGAYWGDAVIGAGAGGLGKSALSGDTGGGASAGGPMGSFGAFLTPFDKQYNLPTLEELKAMPGYQASIDASNEATQRSAAAKGTLLTGGTQRALQQNAGNVAQQAYGQLAGLGMNAFGINRDTFYHNQDAPFSKLMSGAQLGYQAASQQTAGSTVSGYGQTSPLSSLYPNTVKR